MVNQYIYIVGKPDIHTEMPKVAYDMGFKIGLIKDKNVRTNAEHLFDKIIDIDFDNLNDELDRIKLSSLNAAGLVCTYENYVIPKSIIASKLNLPSISLESATASTDKLLMRQAFLKQYPSITPNFKSITHLSMAIKFANKHGYPVMLKPTNLVKSLLVLKCDNEQELKDNFEYIVNNISRLYDKYNPRSSNRNIIIEQYIEGMQYTLAAYVDEMGVVYFCDGVTKVTKAEEIGANDNYLYKRELPTDIDDKTVQKFQDIARKGIEALQMKSSPAHIELIHNEEGIKIVEIGPRTGGYRPRMYKCSYGINLEQQEILLAVGETPNIFKNFNRYCAVFELFPSRTGNFIGLKNDIGPKDVYYHRVNAQSNQLIGPAKDGYKATAIVIVAEEDYDNFINKCKAVDKIMVEVQS